MNQLSRKMSACCTARLNFACRFFFLLYCRHMFVSMLKKTAPWILLPVLLVFGYWSGRVIGTRFLLNLLSSDSLFPLLISRPVDQFYEIALLLNSRNPYSRLSGYYSLLDNK